jgi:hypothetical protein
LITLSAIDPSVHNAQTSGVQFTGISVDIAPSTFSDLQAPVSGNNFLGGGIFSADGPHTLYYASRDGASNAEVIQSTSVYYVSHGPAPAQSVVVSGPAWRKVATATITWTNPPDLAGITGSYFSTTTTPSYVAPDSTGTFLDLTGVLSQGGNTIYLWLQDGLYNVDTGAYAVATLDFDDVPPISSMTAPAFSTGLITASYLASDPGSETQPKTGSGVDHMAVWYRRDAAGDGNFGPWQLVSSSVPGTGGSVEVTSTEEAHYQFYSQGYDAAGNFEAYPGTATVAKAATLVDLTPPHTILLVNGSPLVGPAVVYSTDAVTFQASDALSGVASTSYSIDGGGFVVYGAPISLPAGIHQISFRSVDNAGNSEALQTSASLSTPRVWVGGSTGAWNTASNWSPSQIPGDGDAIVIDADATVTAAGTAIRFGSLTLGDSSGVYRPTLVLATGTASAGDVTVSSGAVWQSAVAGPIVVATMTVLPGGTLTHSFDGVVSSEPYKLNLYVLGEFRLDAGAEIRLDALGYSGSTAVFTNGFGPGFGTYATDASGAGYGGFGGESVKGVIGTTIVPGAPGGAPYGSATYPTDIGSGGGGGYNNSPPCSGSGGGAVILWAGRAVLDGLVSANGGDSGNCAAAGGSGGSINIQAGVLSGGGTMRANGGSSPFSNNQGAGAGGRVWVQGISASSFAGLCQVLPGTVPPKSPPELQGYAAQSGTAFCSALPPAPVISGVSPNRAPSGTSVVLHVYGSGFLNGAVVKLSAVGFPDFVGTGVQVLSPNEITSTFTFPSGASGVRDVVVTNTDTQSSVAAGAFTIQGNSVYWSGGAHDGRWNSPSNWTPAGIPGSSDLVLIDSGVVVLATDAPISFASLVLGDATASAAPSLVMATGTASGGDVTISSGAAMVLETAAPIAFSTMTVASGGYLTHAYNGQTSSEPYKVYLQVANTFAVRSGGLVSVDAKGYAGAPSAYTNGYGPGHGTYFLDSSGAGYGGHGGDSGKYYDVNNNPHDGALGGLPYGSALNPTDIGSGGGGASNATALCSGSGGGAVIVAASTARIDGVISANGGNSGNCAASGGSGGSINIQSAVLTGAGVMRANGGNSPLSNNQGAGGGGRIWAQGSAVNAFTGTCFVSSGTVAPKFPIILRGNPADNGTAFCSAYPGAPTITSIDPSSGTDAAASLRISVTGTGFLTGVGTSVKLSLAGQSDMVSTGVVVSSGLLTAVFDLRSKAAGAWDLTVVNPDGQAATLASTFTLRALAASTTTVKGAPELSILSFQPGVSIVQVSTQSGGAAVALAMASSSGLQLVSDVFDILPVSTFTPPGIITFKFDPSVVTDTSTLAIYRFDGVSWSSTTVPNQYVYTGTGPFVGGNILYTSLWGLFTLRHDSLPPRTVVQVSTPLYVASAEFIAPGTRISFAAVDDAVIPGDGQGFGVAHTYFSLDGGAAQEYTAPLSLSTDGPHSLSWYSVDVVGNFETIHSTSVWLDATPPQTALLVDGVLASTSNLVLVTTDTVSFSTADAGAGVAQAFYSVDAGTPALVAGGFSLPSGAHTVTFQSVDHVGNVEPLRSVALSVVVFDTVAPSIALTPSNGGAVAASLPTLVAAYADSGRGMDLSSVRLGLDGVDVTSASLIMASSATFTPSAALSQATHTFTASASDLAGNPVSIQATFLVDSVPPSTRLTIDGLVAGATDLVLISTDAVGLVADDSGSGVASTRYVLDGAASEVVYASTFTLAAGTHTLTYRSFDVAGNVEAAKTAFFLVYSYDVTPPDLALTPVDQSTVATAVPTLTASYSDSGRGVAAGTARLYLDGNEVTALSTVTASAVSFTPSSALGQGVHVASASIEDLAGNRSSASSRFFLDSLPPTTLLLMDGLPTAATTLVVLSTDTLGFSALDGGTGVAQTVYALDGSSSPSVFVSTFSLPPGVHTLAFHSVDKAGNVEATKSAEFIVVLYDVVPPAVSLSPVDGSTVTTASPVIVAAYSDSGRGIDPASVDLALDGVNVTTSASITVSSAVYMPSAALTQGTHALVLHVSDLAGNRATASAAFFIDSVPPVTTLLVSGLPAGTTNLVVASTSSLGFQATDAGTGVAQTLYALDGAAAVVYASTFSLSIGTHSLAYQSRDQAGNLEALKTAYLTVPSTGTTSAPPQVALTFPSPAALAVEQTLGGIVAVRGSVFSAASVSWTLAVAPGVAVSTGFTAIASGAANVSGLVANWNTASLSGPYTLRLTAVDASGNVAAVTAPVFVGVPAIAFSIGRRGADAFVHDFENPQSLVVRPDGALWVSLDDDSRVVLLAPDGSVLKTLSAAFHFRHPRGLALDTAANLYVADRDGDRVAKVSADGAQLLAQFQSGLKSPNDAIVDSDGSVYVADTGNHRVRVFSAAGAVLRDIVLPHGAQPAGVALSDAGLWVSDQVKRAVYLYSRQGALLKTLPGLGRVRGNAVDHVQALYVVSRDQDSIDKFDPVGSPLLSFGARRHAEHGDRWSLRFLDDPTDAAIGPDGSLWVADSGHDRVVRYALPSEGRGHGRGRGHGVASAGDSANPVPPSKDPVERSIDPQDGGKVERDDGTGVRVPPDALPGALALSVQSADATQDAGAKTRRRRDHGVAPASEEVQYGPEGTQFAAPVTITISYDPALVAASGLNEDDLKIHYWNPVLGDWQAFDSVVDKTAKTVSAQTSHFSVYQVMGGGGGVGTAAVGDPTFSLRAAYAFPNPVHSGGVTLRIQPGQADSVSVRVYDISGRKVHESSDFTVNTGLDDGNGLGAQYTYDHVWDISGVGSGVYTYVITAKKSGQADIHKTGRVGVSK